MGGSTPSRPVREPALRKLEGPFPCIPPYEDFGRALAAAADRDRGRRLPQFTRAPTSPLLPPLLAVVPHLPQQPTECAWKCPCALRREMSPPIPAVALINVSYFPHFSGLPLRSSSFPLSVPGYALLLWIHCLTLPVQ